jgi:hypothetical protein
MILLRTLIPQTLMITCVQCVMSNDVLNMFLLHINDHNQNKKHVDVVYRMDMPLKQVQMIEE